MSKENFASFGVSIALPTVVAKGSLPRHSREDVCREHGAHGAHLWSSALHSGQAEQLCKSGEKPIKQHNFIVDTNHTFKSFFITFSLSLSRPRPNFSCDLLTRFLACSLCCWWPSSTGLMTTPGRSPHPR